jgi:hypothetical protein
MDYFHNNLKVELNRFFLEQLVRIQPVMVIVETVKDYPSFIVSAFEPAEVVFQFIQDKWGTNSNGNHHAYQILSLSKD